jgi:hypothetical protein
MEVNLMQGWLPLREQASVLYKAQHTAQSGLRASVDVPESGVFEAAQTTQSRFGLLSSQAYKLFCVLQTVR